VPENLFDPPQPLWLAPIFFSDFLDKILDLKKKKKEDGFWFCFLFLLK
jgi:hypothetical protein